MNFMSTRANVNETWTTSLYLFPPRSNMTRMSPTKSTVPPNYRFISVGLAHCALAATAGQARIEPSERGVDQRLTSDSPTGVVSHLIRARTGMSAIWSEAAFRPTAEVERSILL
jgi:hypothetical protein